MLQLGKTVRGPMKDYDMSSKCMQKLKLRILLSPISIRTISDFRTHRSLHIRLRTENLDLVWIYAVSSHFSENDVLEVHEGLCKVIENYIKGLAVYFGCHGYLANCCSRVMESWLIYNSDTKGAPPRFLQGGATWVCTIHYAAQYT